MSRRMQASIIIVSAIVLGGIIASAHAAKTSAEKVKATATAGKPDGDGKQEVTIELTIENPYHIYANPVGNDDFADNKTDVTLSAKEKLDDVKITYPAGTEYNSQGIKLKIYKDKATIKATVKRAKGDTSPIEVKIALHACDDKGCLPPGEVKVAASAAK